MSVFSFVFVFVYLCTQTLHTSPGVQTHTFSPKICIQEASAFDANHTKGGNNGSAPNYSLQVYKL